MMYVSCAVVDVFTESCSESSEPKFAGTAIAPLVWLPLYHVSAPLVFGVAAASLLAVVVLTPRDL